MYAHKDGKAERRAGGWADGRAEGYAAMHAFGGQRVGPGNTKRGSIIVPLTSCLTCLDKSVLQIKTKIVSCHTADSKPVKLEVNGRVILPPLVFPGRTNKQIGRKGYGAGTSFGFIFLSTFFSVIFSRLFKSSIMRRDGSL